MKKGIFVATGIAIGLVIAAVAGLWVRPAAAKVPTPQAGADSNNGPMILGTGGSRENRTDISWLLFKDGKVEVKKGVEIDRYVLCCYKVSEQGKSFDLVDVRDVSFDIKAEQLNVAGHEPQFAPANMKKMYAKSLP